MTEEQSYLNQPERQEKHCLLHNVMQILNFNIFFFCFYFQNMVVSCQIQDDPLLLHPINFSPSLHYFLQNSVCIRESANTSQADNKQFPEKSHFN